MLRLEEVGAWRGAFRLEDVHLTVAMGECHAVLGPSGSGKSTLLSAVLGVIPCSGKVRVDGQDISAWPLERRRLGFVPQNLGLFPHLTVRENLRYSARACAIPDHDFDPRLERLIEATGIRTLVDRRPGALSGGERQRVALVRALTSAPKVVLLDEPFTALNESLRRDLWWLVKELQQAQELSVLLISHDLAEAHFLADRVTVLVDGRQEQSDVTSNVYRRPATEPVARLVGVKNVFTAERIDRDLVYCPALGGRLEVDGGPGLQPAGVCRVAIRSEHVALRRMEEPPLPDEARLEGRFEAVLDLGEAALMRFRTDAGTLLEVRAGSRVLRRFELHQGQRGVVGLPRRDLFLLDR